MANDRGEQRTLLLYELFAAAGASKHPPVAPELAKLIAERLPPETLAQFEHLYPAIERAAAEGRPSDELEDAFERAKPIIDRLQ